MKLYHFTNGKLAAKIMKEGITKGAVCIPGKYGNFVMRVGYIWLTTDPVKGNQSWATRHLVKYDRTEYRLEIEIPDSEAGELFDAETLDRAFPGAKLLFIGWPGSEKWRVWRGFIPPGWIKECVKCEA